MLCIYCKNGLKKRLQGFLLQHPQVEIPTFDESEEEEFSNIFDILGSI